MSKTSWFPVWLPYPKAWIMAMKLGIPAYFGATVIFAFEFWRYSLVGSILAVTNHNGIILFFIVSVGALLLALIWFLILAGVYALLLKFLWSNPPQWLRLPKFSSLVIRDFTILVFSILPIIGIFAIYILFITGLKQSFDDLRQPKLTYDIFLLRFWWLWLISAAYFYQISMKKFIRSDKY
ncbi:hypothetical protein [Nostoc sp. TCL26-01]|uniref:hypothetical protein n=1 Tax=Nostoc sp. TCL26-01 TaxID=2576904 RepID=UPI0015BA8C00|nr:hypothetical protein [Nostoc sp. TCL26-01]QLE59198.1 hypothetical protein FD725_29090 [Nostoc sp. TCL26-01]